MEPIRTPQRLRDAAAAVALAAVPAWAAAHGDHGPGGHDGWTLDHAAWGAPDWGLAGCGVAALLAAAVGGRALLRRHRARRRPGPR